MVNRWWSGRRSIGLTHPPLPVSPNRITQLGASLQEMLDACSLLGTEALVEVHTVAELEKALELGATNIVATNWDRVENQLYPEQAKGLKFIIPDLIVAIAAGRWWTVGWWKGTKSACKKTN